MKSTRNIALVAGVLYLLTFVSIPTLALYGSVHDPNYMVGLGPDTPVIIGAILEIIVALAGIGTAVVLFPVLKKQNEGVALGFVGSRVLEAATIFAGVAFLLSVVTLRQSGAGADALVTGRALVALYDRMFLIGQSFMPAVNASVAGLPAVPVAPGASGSSLIGLVGAPLLVAATSPCCSVSLDGMSPSTAIAALPVALWEFSLGVWLTVKGFNPSAIEFKADKTLN